MSKLHVALDTETGGLDPKTSDLLTIYIGIADENFKVIDELDLKLKPDNDRLPVTEAGAMKVNGIDLQKHLADPTTLTYSDASAQIQTMLKRHLKKNGRYSNLIPLGHNIPFDLNFIHHHIMNKEEWEKFCHYRTIDTNPIIWLMKDSGWWPNDLSNLGSVVDFLGLPKRNAHTAKDDTLMTLDLYKKMLEIMKAKKEGGGATQDLIALLESE
jgi:DNA polymerase III alpha subunit (gram-positive type)